MSEPFQRILVNPQTIKILTSAPWTKLRRKSQKSDWKIESYFYPIGLDTVVSLSSFLTASLTHYFNLQLLCSNNESQSINDALNFDTFSGNLSCP